MLARVGIGAGLLRRRRSDLARGLHSPVAARFQAVFTVATNGGRDQLRTLLFYNLPATLNLDAHPEPAPDESARHEEEDRAEEHERPPWP